MAYTKYSLTPANNNSAPPDGAPEGMLPSAVNDTMRDMMAQIRDCGDGIRDGTYTMTAAKITGGTITGVTFSSIVVTGGSINNTSIGASTASTGAFSTLSATGATTFSGATVANTFSSSGATITGGTINSTAIGGSTAAAGKFTTLEATGVTTVQAGTAALPAITTTGDTNTGIFFPAADTIAFSEGGTEVARFNSSGNLVLNNALNSSSGVLATQNGMTGICKAWVFYKGIATEGIQGSFNVSSVTYNSTGLYTINMTTALPNSNYAVTTGVSGNGSGGGVLMVDDPTASTYSTTQFTLRSRANTGAASTDEYVHCAVFSS